MYGYDVPSGSDFGVTSLAQPQQQRTPEVQAYIDALEAYAAQQKGAGYLVRPQSSMGADYSSLLSSGVKPEDYYQLGHQFRTNAGKLAKTKANPTAEIYFDPTKSYALINERGDRRTLLNGEGMDNFNAIIAKAQELSRTGGTKADWKITEFDPTSGQFRTLADDDPKGPLGKIADFALPVLGAMLMPVTGGMSGALAAGLGAAGGSALSGIAQGRGIGDILKGSAISGLGAFAGGSLLNGIGGAGAQGAVQGATQGATQGAVQGAVQGGLSGVGGALGDAITVIGSKGLSALGGLGAGVGAAAGGALGSVGGGGGYEGQPQSGEIVVNAPTNPSPWLDPALAIGGLGAGVGAAAAGGGTAGGPENVDPNTIEVTGSPASPPPIPPELALGAGAVGAGAAAAGGGTSGVPENVDPNTIEVTGSPASPPPIPPELALGAIATGGLAYGLPTTAGTPPPGPNSTLDDIVKYLRAAGLLTGFVGDLFGGGGGGGGSSARGNWKPSQLNPVFSAQLPGPSGSLANRQPRTMPDQDWNQYAMRPEQSFWNDVPQRYSPPPPSGSGGSMGGSLPSPPPPPSGSGGSMGGSLPSPPQGVRLRPPGYAEGGRADSHLARVSEGEYIIDAETVALLGDGSNDAGARKLDELRVNLRKDKGRDLARGEFSVDAKMPMEYIGGRN